MELPRSLSAWRRQLEIFPPDVALTLGRLVQRIAPVFGPLQRAGDRGGEPDGFGGISRRGSYERLLGSEWAVAELSMDEFMRRAASGEHAFLEVAQREPARARACAALFECGPDALGSPRIAELAMLILLAQRAEAAGASFGWHLLHALGSPLLDGVSRSNVQRLIDGRTLLPLHDSDIQVWIERLSLTELDELWLVGSPRLLRATGGSPASTIVIEDVLEPDVRRLGISVRARRTKERKLLLDMPDDPECARLLRDPFALAVAPPGRTAWAPTSELVFSSNLQKLFARDASGAIISFPIPNSPRAGVGRPKQYRSRSGRPVAAVGWSQRSIIFATCDATSVSLESPRPLAAIGGLTERQLFADVGEPRPAAPLQNLAFQTTAGVPKPPLLMIAPSGALLELLPPDRVVRVADECSVLAPLRGSPGGVVFVGRGVWRTSKARFASWRIVWLKADGDRAALRLDGAGDFAAVIGRTPHDVYATIAVRQRARIWTLRWADRSVDLDPGDAHVVGIMDGPSQHDAPGLVLLDEQSLVAVSRSWSRPLVSRSPIVRAAVSSTSTHLAYLTEDGVLTIRTLPDNKILARFETRAVAKAAA